MIPQSNTVPSGLHRIRHPTHTYRMDLHDPRAELSYDIKPRTRIAGYTDSLSAMEQAVFKILRTDRYKYVIYDWNYGVELDDLYGKPKPYAKAQIPKRITEALLADDRINAVDGFAFTDLQSSDRRTTVIVSFTVHTIHGSFTAKLDVLL